MLSKRPAGNDVIALKQMFLQSMHLNQHVVGSETLSKCRINSYLVEEPPAGKQTGMSTKQDRQKHEAEAQ